MVLVAVKWIEVRTERNEDHSTLRKQKELNGRYKLTLTYNKKIAGGIEKLPKLS